MNELLLIYPYDPQGTIPINFIKQEMHKLTSSQGEDYAFLELRKGPFHKKDLSIKDKASNKVLEKDLDYRLTFPFINDQTRLDCYRIVEIINKDYFDSVLLVDYRTLGADMVFDEIEILEHLANREINPKVILWSEIVDKPGRYPVEVHLHHIKDFFGMNELVSKLKERLQRMRLKYEELVQITEDHIAAPNAHNIALIDIKLHRLRNLYPATAALLTKVNLTKEEKLAYLTPKLLVDYVKANYLNNDSIESVHLDGPKEVVQDGSSIWRITNYDVFSEYSIQASFGTFSIEEDLIYGDFYVTDGLGEKSFWVTKNQLRKKFNITVNSAGIVKPSILGLTDGATNVPLATSFYSTIFKTVPVNKDSLVEVVYQISTTPSFSDIVYSGTTTDSNEPINVSLGKKTKYYLRTKHYGTIYTSDWSNIVSFDTVDVKVPNLSIKSGSTVSGDRFKHDFVVLADVENTYLSEELVEAIEYRLVEKMADVTKRPVIAFSGTKLIDYSNLAPTLNWCPLSSSDNAIHGTYGNGGYNDSPGNFKSNTDYELSCRIRLNESDWSDWSSALTIKTASVTTQIIQVSEMVGTGDNQYLHYYDKEINIYS